MSWTRAVWTALKAGGWQSAVGFALTAGLSLGAISQPQATLLETIAGGVATVVTAVTALVHTYSGAVSAKEQQQPTP